jgi:6-carboxyhexanoate--CoA ligase
MNSDQIWSIRMRASERKRSKSPYPSGEMHISGAEGIYSEKDIETVIRQYTERAYNHPRGRPDSVTITIEKISRQPISISTLPVLTADCATLKKAETLTCSLLRENGISEDAISAAFDIVRNRETMRGAALIHAGSGKRKEPDKIRGIRVSRLGITRTAERKLSEYLRSSGIDSGTVREALILASKVASCSRIIAELCISDDPDYTTGYIASVRSGYVRIPNIKRRGSRAGGRVFFLKGSGDISSMIEYLEQMPAIVTRISV